MQGAVCLLLGSIAEAPQLQFPCSAEAAYSPSHCLRLCLTSLPTGWIWNCSNVSLLLPSHTRPPITRQLPLVSLTTGVDTDTPQSSTRGLKQAASPLKECWHRTLVPNTVKFPKEKHLSVKTSLSQTPKNPTDFSSSPADCVYCCILHFMGQHIPESQQFSTNQISVPTDKWLPIRI